MLELLLVTLLLVATTVAIHAFGTNHDWRLLSGIEALNGILLVGWTTAFLFMVVQRSWTTKAPGQDGK